MKIRTCRVGKSVYICLLQRAALQGQRGEKEKDVRHKKIPHSHIKNSPQRKNKDCISYFFKICKTT